MMVALFWRMKSRLMVVPNMQEVGRAFQQAVAGRQRGTELQETARLDAGIGKIRSNNAARLFHVIAAGERDAHTAHRVRTGIFDTEMGRPVVVERNRTDAADSLCPSAPAT